MGRDSLRGTEDVLVGVLGCSRVRERDTENVALKDNVRVPEGVLSGDVVGSFVSVHVLRVRV